MSNSVKAAKESTKILQFCDFGHALIPYEVSLRLQHKLADQVKADVQPDTLLQLQHSPVYTLGKRGRQEDFRTSTEVLREKGAAVFEIGRGGETTFHGPGQVVLYPIISLRRLGRGARAYVEGLEDTVIDTLLQFGINAEGRLPGRTGVWTGDRKIAAIGVQISRGIATHGLAVNVTTDLTAFDHIVPCGLPDKAVTSVEREAGDAKDTGADLVRQVSATLRESFAREFGFQELRETRIM